MQLKPEFEVVAFENVYSMSGMPDQGYNVNNHHGDHQNEDDNDGFRSYLSYNDGKAGSSCNTSLKRRPEDDIMASEANKRAKAHSDFTTGFQQTGMGQFGQGGMTDGNIFNTELQQRAAFAQQQMGLDSMNSMGAGFGSAGLGSAGLGIMERRMEQENNRQQQQSAMLANEMALMNQMNQINSSNQASYGNSDASFGGPTQRQQLFDGSNDLFNNNSFAPMQDFQNLQGLSQLSSMSAQPFLSNMLDFSLLNNRLSHQGLGGFNAGTLPPVGGATSLNQSMNQQRNMTASSHQANHSGPSMGQLQAAGFSAGAGAPSADQMSSLSALEVLQLSRMQNAGASSASLPQQQAVVPQQQPSNRAVSEMSFPAHSMQRQTNQLLQLEVCQPVLPPLEEANTPHYSQRTYSSFAIDEDPNWLSEFQCFIRSEILELFRVSQQGIKVRNAMKSLAVNQVGIRCRFCAHLQHGTRANRASCFPSKIDKIYQSFTMMLREHFPSCTEIPEAQKQRFVLLQNMNAQGASNAKGFWEHAAKKKGLVDMSEENGRGGIHIFERTQAQAALIPPFGADSHFQEPQPPVTLIQESDRGLVSNFLHALMEQVYRVHLAPSERKGNRKSLRPGMPGFGCRYCYDAGRMGLCRLFPARRRTIHTKIPDLFDHMKRCPLCPQQVKDNLIYLNSEDNGDNAGSEQDTKTRGREREFFERIWARLGHQDDSE